MEVARANPMVPALIFLGAWAVVIAVFGVILRKGLRRGKGGG